MIIRQTHIVPYDYLLDEEDIGILQNYDADNFVEVVTRNNHYYSDQVEKIYDIWSLDEMLNGDFTDDDVIIVDPEYPQKELLAEIGYSMSNQKTEHGYVICFRSSQNVLG